MGEQKSRRHVFRLGGSERLTQQNITPLAAYLAEKTRSGECTLQAFLEEIEPLNGSWLYKTQDGTHAIKLQVTITDNDGTKAWTPEAMWVDLDVPMYSIETHDGVLSFARS